MAWTQDEIIQYYKNKNPGIYTTAPDEEVYRAADNYALETYGKNLAPYIPKQPPPNSVGNIPVNTGQDGDRDDLSKVDVSPNKLKGLSKFAASIGTDISASGFLAEMFPEGIDLPGEAFDISPEFFQKSYNESLAGQAYQAIHGREAYDVGDYTNDNDLQGWLAESGQFILGMLNAPEVAAYASGAKLGLWGAMKGTSLLNRYGILGLTKSAIQKGSVGGVQNRALSTALVHSGIETGVALGTLGAAHSATHSAAAQKMETGQIDANKVLLDGAKGFGESFLIGAPAGMVSKGLLGSRYAMAKLASDKKALDITTKVMYGLPSQIGTEALAFTTLPSLYKHLGEATGVPVPESFKQAPGILDEGYTRALFQNTVLIGTMVGFGHAARKMKGIDDTHIWALKLLEQGKRDSKKLVNSQERVKERLEEGGINVDPEMLKLIGQERQKASLSEAELNDFKTNQKIVKKIIEKIESQGSESLTPKEIEQLADLAGPVKLVEVGTWDELLKNPTKLRKIIEEQAGGKITDKDFSAYQTALEVRMNDTIATFGKMNEIMTGINPNPPVQQAGAKTPTTKTPITPETYIQQGIITKDNPLGLKKKTVSTVEDRAELLEQNKNIPSEDAHWKLEQPGQQPAPGEPAPGKPATGYPVSSNLEQKLSNIEQRLIKLTSEINVSDINADVTSRNLLKKTDKYTQQIKNKIVNPDDRNLAAYLLDLYPVERGKQKIFIDNVSEILGFVRKKYNKPISELNTPELTKLVKDYIQDKAGFDVFDKKAWKNLDEKQKITLGRFVDKTRDNMFEIFGDTAGGLAGLLKTNPLNAFKKVGIKGQRSITIVGGKDGLKGWIKHIQSKEKHTFKSGKNEINVSKEEGYLFSELFMKSEVRPEEIANLKVKDITDTGINISLSKGKGITPDKVRFIEVEPKLLKQFKKMVEGRNPNSFVFENLNTSKKISDFAKYLSNNTEFKIQIKDEATGKFYELGETIPGGKKVGNLSGVKSMTAEKGLSLGRVFRAIFKKGNLKEKAAERQQSERAAEEYVVEEGQPKYQTTAEGTPASPKELAPWLDAQIKKNPGLALRKLKDADFVGRFYEGVIDVTMGKANKFTFFHENAHRLKAMIDASGNKRLSKVWNQAEKIFKKEAKGRNMEEFLADEIARYGLKREQPATLKQKMGGWLNRVWSTVKSVFFGKERLTKNDVKNILGEKVFKGFEFNVNSKANSIARYKYATTEEFSKGLKKQFKDSLTDKLNKQEQKALEEYIASSAGIENPELFKLGSKDVKEADLILFQEKMKSIPFLEIKSAASIQAKSKLIRNIEINGQKALTPKQQENVMKLLGFKNKTLWGATVEQLKGYSDIINSTRMPNQTRVAGIAESATTGQLSDIMKQMDGLIGDAAKAALPVGAVMRKLGLKDIASKMEDHISVELNHVGKFILFETAGERTLGKRTFGKAKEHLYLMDVERYIERKDLGLLTRAEQKFIDKAFKSDWVIEKNGKLVKNSKYNGAKFKDAINLNTPQGKVVESWVNYTDYVFKNFKESVKANLSETEYLNFVENNNINWIRDNIYVSRLVTDKFKKVFNLGGKAYDKLIEKQTAPLAEKLAKKKFNTDKPTDEQIGNVWEDAQMHVRNDIADMLQFNKGKHSTRFLKKRHTKLPEFVEIDGKKIKVYETGYENTVKKYALGMSKFMANTEVFPEFVNLKGMNFPGRKDAINKLITANNKWGPWARDRVEHQLGYLQKPGDYQSTTAKIMSGAAQVLAKTQLSFPTSGLKNLVLGQSATLQAFRMRDYLAGLAKIMSKEFRDEVKGTGATEIGLRHIQDLKFGKADKMLERIFWFGGMKPTENVNRYMSIAASKVQQNRLVEIISNKKHSSNKRKKAERRLEDFYSISKEELGLLKKYGMSGVDDVSFSSNFAKSKERRTMQNIYNKMNSMAHIKTQGASLSFFMPEWADGKFLRPLTLFKRMAYASTVNSVNNFKLAYKNGNMVKMGMHLLGPYLTGTALIAVYDNLFDQKPPTENSAAWSHMKYVYMRGEFLGVLSDFMKMYEGESAQQTVYPALYNYLVTAASTALKLSKGQMNWEQSGEEMLKTTFGAYRGMIKLADKNENQYKVRARRFRNLWYEFLDETYPNTLDDSIGERKLTRRSPYYADLKTVFENGSAKQFTKQYYITVAAVATSFWNESMNSEAKSDTYASIEDAFKMAERTVNAKITTFNPNPGSFLKIKKSQSKEDKFKNAKRAIAWNKWLSKDPAKAKEYLKELKTLEAAYWLKRRNFERELKLLKMK